MRSKYKKLGPYIEQVDIRNSNNEIKYLRGVSSIHKKLMKSKANIIGADMSRYKILERNQFVFNPNTARMGDKIPIALNTGKTCIVSQIYPVFEIKDTTRLLPEYLMMWFRRPEFDRYARFKSHGSAREIFDWEEMCNVELPIPSLEKQQEIVNEYNTVVNRIKLNQELNIKLEETAQTIYKHWFVDFEFPISKEYADSIGKPELEGQPYKSSGGEMVYNEDLEQEIPDDWFVEPLGDLIKYKKGFPIKSEWYTSKGSKVVRVSNLTDKSIDVSDCNHIDEKIAEDLSEYRLRTNDTIIATVGSWPQNPASTVGNVVKVPELANGSILNQNAVRIRPLDGVSEYLLYVTLKKNSFSEYVISGAQGSANQASVTLKHIFAFPVVLTDNENYERLAEIFKFLFQLLNKLETEISLLKDFLEILLSSLVKTDKLYGEVH